MTTTTTLQKALITIKKLKQLLKEQNNKKFEPIAIIGLGCRFPQAQNKEDYWQLLCQGQNAISELPEERWDLFKKTEEYFLRDKKHRYFGSFLQNITAFDAYFFGISPREAMRMDPQQRILLEVAYEAIEDTGLSIESLAGSNTGVFASLYASQFAYFQELDNELDALFIPTGNATSIAANRLSYLFDLRGPSFVLDTACSSSLVSLHLACLNLQNKLCDLALVCGANINLLPSINSVLAKAKMLSPDGQCKTFDASANGYVQGEGVGVIVLKSLTKAIHDNDKIYAVINGSAVNQDGKTNGLTAPNGLQQEQLIQTAYQIANIHPKNVSYIECHGTGTFLGDPIEIQALGEVVGKNRDKDSPCWIGSVKTNIGHLEPAAGIASVIKVALSLHHAQIPPHLNFVTPNPHIAFDKYHLRIPGELQKWPQYGECRVAGVSGFGFGGTNAHVVMGEYRKKEIINDSPSNETKPELFTLSAKDPQALRDLIIKWSEFLEKNSAINLAQLCYNTHVRRSHYSHRLAIITDSIQDLYHILSTIQLDKTQHFSNVFLSQTVHKEAQVKLDLDNINLNDLATAYVQHIDIDWKRYENHRNFAVMDMPIYCWQHKNYWPSLKNLLESKTEQSEYPLQGKEILSPLQTLQFEFQFNTQFLPEIHDTYHILHAGYYLEMISFGLNKINHPLKFTIENLEFLLALIVPDHKTVTVQLIFELVDKNQFKFHFYSFSETQNKWLEHAKGTLNLIEDAIPHQISLEHIKVECSQTENVNCLYDKILAMGMPAGDSIRWTCQYFFNSNEVLCEFATPESCKNNQNFMLNIHPGIIDGCIQPLFKLVPDNIDKPYMASTINKIICHGFHEPNLFLSGKIQHISEQQIVGDVILVNQQGIALIEFEGITLKQLDNKIQIQKLMQDSEENKTNLGMLSVEERKEYITNFLLDQIGKIFSMPKQDIDINQSLRDLGIDSLMALVLMKAMESGLGTSYSLQLLLEGPSICDITNFVLNTMAAPAVEIFSSPWVAYRKPQNQPQQRLFCFPYGGGGASIYREWQQGFPSGIEVCPIQLPGRENRMGEKPITDIYEMINELIKNLGSLFDRPFAFYGHSFGSLIAFELTRHLRKNNLPLPMHLFLSAFPDPRTPTKNLDRLLSKLNEISITLNDINNADFIQSISDDKLYQLSNIFNDNGIVDYGDHLMNRDVIKILLPIFFGDMSIVKSYKFHEESPLDLPITIFLGKNDTWVDYEHQHKWKEHTINKCLIHEFNSGHLFLKDKLIRNEMFRVITDTLNLKQTVDTMF